MADFRYLTPWVGDCLQLNLQGIEIELLKADVRAYIFLIRFQQAPYAILKTTALCHQAICPVLDRLRVQNGYYALEWLEKHQPTILAPRLLTGLLNVLGLEGIYGYFQTVLPGYSFNQPAVKNFSNEDCIPFFYEMGQQLTLMHGVTHQRVGFLQNALYEKFSVSWEDFFNQLWHQTIEAITPFKMYLPVPMERILEFYCPSDPLLKTVQTVLCHGDIGHGNIMMDASGHFAGWIDWDECLFGDVVFDLSPIFTLGFAQMSLFMSYKMPLIDAIFKKKVRLYRLLKLLRFYVLNFQTQMHEGRPLMLSERLNYHFCTLFEDETDA